MSVVSVGQLLKHERERKNLTLKQIEKEIKVREKFLQALEENRWDMFPSQIYITGIIKNYAKYLNLDIEKITAFFRRDYEKQDDLRFKRRVSSQYFTPQTKQLAWLSLFVVLLFFSLYFGYQIQQFLSPPKVVITAPTSDHFRAVDKISVVGRTEKEAIITIYGEKVYPNGEGIFTYDFPLHEGRNELIIEVVGANGKSTTIKKIYTKE